MRDKVSNLQKISFGMLNRFLESKKKYSSMEPHPGLILAKVDFDISYPNSNDVSFLTLASMDLLLKLAYLAVDGFSKFTISLTMISTSGDVTFTLGPAISLTCSDGKVLLEDEVYSQISSSLAQNAEKYNGFEISSLSIRVYLEGKKKMKERAFLSDLEITSRLSSFLQSELWRSNQELLEG